MQRLLKFSGNSLRLLIGSSICRSSTAGNFLREPWKNTSGGFVFGRSSDSAGFLEGIHDQHESPAALLIDECKSIPDAILETFERCHTSYRLFMSSTGQASGEFYRIMTAQSHLWRTFRVTSDMCSHISKVEIEADRENLKDSVFAVKHDARFLYDSGTSMISLEHVRALVAAPPAFAPGRVTAFADFAGPGDQSALSTCNGNRPLIEDAWVHRDTMHSVGKFINLFKRLGLQGFQVGGDEGYGHQLMDRMAELG